MPISDRKYKRMTLANVNVAPLQRGVYALYAKRDLVFLGHAAGKGDTLRSRLRAHLTAAADGATHYKRETAPKPKARLKELLDEFVAEHGHPPAQNAQKKA